MTVEHVEIDEIREDQTFGALSYRFGELRHSIGVVLGSDVVVDATTVIDVVNLAHAEDWRFALGENVKQQWLGRLDGVIMTPLSALKVTRWAGKRSRNYASHAIGSIENLPRDFAHAIQLGDGDDVFM